MDAGLYIVGTPIGNLADLGFRALEVLREADEILAEDTRRTGRLLSRYELRKRMTSCHKFNEQKRVDTIVGAVRAGAAVAMVTDGGMPCVSDPGSRVVRGCREQGVPIVVIPGPSAVSSVVALSGLGEQGFVFLGFLPHKSGARRRALAARAQEPLALVLFESPYRLLKLMGELEEVLPERRVFVGRELTKKFEEGIFGSPGDIRGHFDGRTVKGECAVVVEGCPRKPGERT